MEIWTAFILGLVGSLHCAGMCGPLALALPTSGHGVSSFLLGRTAYNVGRVTTYGVLGALFGLLGMTFALAGLQRWTSLAAGTAILLGLAASSRFALQTPVVTVVAWLKRGFAKLLGQRTLLSLFFLGLLNGLLPCGLVYVACAGAVAAGGFIHGVEYMVTFGLGTIPMMLGIALAGKKLQFTLRFRAQRVIPLCLVALAALLILRGLSLGIPYLSPDLSPGPSGCSACH